MVLASEPICICGVDVAAPQQLRMRGKQRMSVAELKAIFAKQFTPYEARLISHKSLVFGNLNSEFSRRAQAACMAIARRRAASRLHALWALALKLCVRCSLQWEAIEGAGSTSEAQEAVFRRHWSLKEVRSRGVSSWCRVHVCVMPPVSLLTG